MESLKGKTFNEYVYCIIRNRGDNTLKLEEVQTKLERGLTNEEIWGFIPYTCGLADSFNRYFPENPIPKADKRGLEREYRIQAIAFLDTCKRVKREYGIKLVACSHRIAGWKETPWTYNGDIKFSIDTNFGFGSSSYFSVRYYYKGMQLAPYSNYILYRHANYSSVVRFTYSYPIAYRYWKELMETTIKFYNAVSNRQEHEVFSWIKEHLERLVSGLRNLLTSNDFYFHDGGDGGEMRTHERIHITGEELIHLRAEKISGAVAFVRNIEKLPTATNPSYYINRLNNIFRDFLTWVQPQIRSYQNRLDKLVEKEKEIRNRPLVKTYHQLLENEELKNYEISPYSKYYYDRKIILIRKLLKLRNEKYPHLSNEEFKESIVCLVKSLRELEENASSQGHAKGMIGYLAKSQSQVEEYFLSINSD